jgi:hypothetical protein
MGRSSASHTVCWTLKDRGGLIELELLALVVGGVA